MALRTLTRSKGYATVTIATLAIAIGANTAVFSVLYSVLLRALPYPEPAKLLDIGRASGSRVESVTYPDFERWRDNSRALTAVAAYFQNTGVSRVTLTSGAEPESAKAAFVSASFFEVMGVPPRIGRAFTVTEERASEPVAILSDATWRKRFAASESLDGADIHINGLAYRVIGVMPPGFAWPAREIAAWVPITRNANWTRRAGPVPLFRAVGRLAPGITSAMAREELRSLYTPVEGTAGAVPVRPPLDGDRERMLYLLAAAVALVLLIACANIASLTVARGNKRASEIALRVALGAGRARVALEMFAESLLLAAIGAVSGVLLGSLATSLLIRFRPDGFERMEQAGLDPAVLAFSAAATLLAAVLFGLLPAWQLSARDPIEAIRGPSRGSSRGAQAVRLRKWIVASELALTVVLLSGAGLMLRSLAAASNVSLGFDPRGAFTFRVLFPDSVPHVRKTEYFRTLFERLHANPQITAAGAVNDLFEVLSPGNLGLREIEGRPPEPRDIWTPLTWTTVGGQYFEAMGARLVRGRWFQDSDGPGSPLVALIDEGAARRYWPGEDPVGRRFKGQDTRGRNDEWVSVIGVVRNMRRQGLDREPTPHIYEWYRQGSNLPRDIVIRANGPAGNEARAIARALDPTVVLSGVTTMEFQIDDQLANRRFQSALLTIFAAIAFTLAAVGVYGVVTYSASMRTREFGIRAALGESQFGLCFRVIRESLGTASTGILLGLLAAALAAHLVRALVFGISTLDPVSLGGSCALLAVTTLAAACVPAIRAARADPATTLRQE